MKKILINGLIILASLSIMAFAGIVATWTVISERTEIKFDFPSAGTAGTFSGTSLKASIELDENDLTHAKITATIDASTLNTGDEGKDKHLKSLDYFDVEHFPEIKFVTESIGTSDSLSTPALKTYNASGTLTIKGITQKSNIYFTFENNKQDAGILSGKMTVNAADFGLMKKGKEDKVTVSIIVPVKK